MHLMTDASLRRRKVPSWATQGRIRSHGNASLSTKLEEGPLLKVGMTFDLVRHVRSGSWIAMTCLIDSRLDARL